MKIGIAAVAVLLCASTSAQSVAQTPDAATIQRRVSAALGALLQADAAGARNNLAALPQTDLPPRVAALRTCILERLSPPAQAPAPTPDSPFAERVLQIYRDYWRQAANAPAERDAAQAALTQRLAILLDRPDQTDLDAIEGLILTRVRADGEFGLAGQTGLLRDMMIWRSQEVSDVDVALPEGRQTTHLFLLRDFRSRGWAHWLSCETSGSGGWAKPEGLYAIAAAWDLEGEAFRASFLGHESQHFADYAAFPGLAGRDLEFRAKLTELTLADASLEDRLRLFESNQSDNPDDAHSYANRRVLAALRDRLGLSREADLHAVPRDRLRDAARQVLLADSARRRAETPAA